MTTRLIFRVARTADLSAMRELITTEFVQNEPIAKHLQYTKTGFTKVYDRFAAHIDLSTTVVVEEVQEGNTVQPSQLVSCHVSIPLSAHIDLEDIPEQRPVNQLFDELNAPLGEVLKKKSIPESRVLHSMFGATKQEYHGKGLYKQIMDLVTQEILKDHRWDMAISESTSPVTQHIKKHNLGWTEETFMLYEEFEMKGKRPFKGLDGGVALMWKDYRGIRGAL